MLYFAYGSNMSMERLEDRIGPVRRVCTAELKNHKFVFNKVGTDGTGKANLMPYKNEVCYGVVFEITTTQRKKLDCYEGAPSHYVRVRKTVHLHIDGGKKSQRVYMYLAVSPMILQIKPTSGYLEHILTGIFENKFSREYYLYVRALAYSL